MTPEERLNAQMREQFAADGEDSPLPLPYSPENYHRPPLESIYKQRGGNLYLPPEWDRDTEEEVFFRQVHNWIEEALGNPTNDESFLTYTTPENA